MREGAPGRLPVATLAFVAASLAVSFALPGGPLRASLGLERAAVLHGELWRLWSGHLLHDHVAHALWNLAAFGVLGVWLERCAPARFALALALSAPLSAAAVVALRPDLASYQGASALASALYALGAAGLLREGPDRRARFAGALALALFAAKVALESAELWPSPALPPGLESVALAHVVGGTVGALTGLAPGEYNRGSEGRTTWHFRRRSRRSTRRWWTPSSAPTRSGSRTRTIPSAPS